ncbi:unnamed protein product [Enterobius vermicularis]|uniref:ZP domain-containing protein n=1 Tax=Enterobius vermicularis TaxID=51028 RepID=A0A0N4VK15_ENTVE|nr:unnamed protein product [Enterobius vermicularis]
MYVDIVMEKEKKRCIPHCNEKRDFQDIHPERTKEDFYKSYDPLVGVSTASILAVIMLYFVARCLFNCLERQLQLIRYRRRKNREDAERINANGHLNF